MSIYFDISVLIAFVSNVELSFGGRFRFWVFSKCWGLKALLR